MDIQNNFLLKNNEFNFYNKNSVRKYWEEEFKDITNYTIAQLSDSQMEKLTNVLVLNKEESKKIKDFCQTHLISESVFFLGLYGLMVNFYMQPEKKFHFNEITNDSDTHHDEYSFKKVLPIMVEKNFLNKNNILSYYNFLKSYYLRTKDFQDISPSEINAISGDPQINFNYSFSPLPIKISKEKLNERNRIGDDYKTFLEIISEKANQYSKNLILKHYDQSLTYAELEAKSNQMAQYLISEVNSQPGDRVGVLLNDPIGALIAIVAIWKAECIYVPLPPSLQTKQIQIIIEEQQINTVISEKKLLQKVNLLQWECSYFQTFLCIDTNQNIFYVKEQNLDLTHEKEVYEYFGEIATDEMVGGGWYSSYTGEPFLQEELNEYGENALKKLQPLINKNMRVLELGCASGVTMFRVAPHVKHYMGTDFSRAIIAKNKKRVEKEGYKNIELAYMAAHEVDVIEGEFDLIIINGVIQDFNEHNYLRLVIKRCINKLSDNGYIFIGDIYDQEKKQLLIDDLLNFKEANSGKKYTTKTDLSGDLFISRAFICDLSCDLKEISHIEFSDKIHTIENETTKFRYDALLKINKLQYSEKTTSKSKNQHDLSTLEKYNYNTISRVNPSQKTASILYSFPPKGKVIHKKTTHSKYIENANLRKERYNSSNKEITILNIGLYDLIQLPYKAAEVAITAGMVILQNPDPSFNIDHLYLSLIKDNVDVLEGPLNETIPLLEHIYHYKLNPGHLKLISIGPDTCNNEMLLNINNHFGNNIQVINDCKKDTEDYWYLNEDNNVTLKVLSLENHYKIVLDYNPQLFSYNYFLDRLNLLSSQIISGTKEIISLEYFLGDEKLKLANWNTTNIDYPEKNILELFESQVNATPDNIALVINDRTITYFEINAEVNRIANYLDLKYQIKEDDKIGLILERNEWMIIGILAVLKTGGCYVPIEPSLPSARIEFILNDCKCATYLYSQTSGLNLSLKGEDIARIECDDKENPNKSIQSSQLAYILYTSGTTGNPKGVMIEHKSLYDYVQSFKDKFNLSSSDATIPLASYSFDVSIEEIFPMLCSGGRLILTSNRQDLSHIIELIQSKNVTIISTVPQVVKFFNNQEDKIKNLRLIICGADVLTPEDVNNIYDKQLIYNAYGPTESTVSATFHLVNKLDQKIPIGRPFTNREIYIIDSNGNILPPGFLGEICIGGKGLSQGYLNNDLLTREKFISIKGMRLYKSGDMGRWLDSGEIEFLGRIDDQIKIRGHRVELKEIEQQIKSIKGIEDSVVVLKENTAKEQYLCAYYLSKSKVTYSVLREKISQRIPDYMVPSHFIRINEIPLTINGKIDKRKLPEPITEENNNFVGPRNEVESKLADILSSAIGRDKARIDINTSVFEYGGTSITLINLINQIKKSFSSDINFASIYNNATISNIVNFINTGEEIKSQSSLKEEHGEFYKTIPSQRGMYFFQKFNPASVFGNLSELNKIKGEVDFLRLERAFIKVIENYEILRTSFQLREGEVTQKIVNDFQFKLEYLELNEINSDSLAKPFNLSNPPLIRVVIFNVLKDYYLYVDIPHIAHDGHTMDALLDDIRKIYADESFILPKRFQYKEYVKWYNSYLSSDLYKKQEQFWLKELENIKELKIPTDFPDNKSSSQGRSYIVDFPDHIFSILTEYTTSRKKSLFSCLMSSFLLFISKLTRQEDVSVAFPVFNRNNAEIEDIVGLIVNNVIIRREIKPQLTFEQLNDEVESHLLELLNNQEYPIDVLQEKIGKANNRNSGNKSLYSIYFNFETIEREMNMGDFSLIYQIFPTKTEKRPLSLHLFYFKDKITARLSYRSDLLKEETIHTYFEQFILLIEKVITNPDDLIIDAKIF